MFALKCFCVFVKNGSQQIDSGFGIRSISKDKTGFSYGNNFDYDEIIKASKLSKSIVQSKSPKSLKLKEYSDFKKLYISDSPLTSVSDDRKVDFLKEMNKYIKKNHQNCKKRKG